MSSSAAVRVPTRPASRPATRPRPQQPRLRVVAPTHTRSRAGLAVACVALLGAGLVTLLLLNISLNNGSYELAAAQKAQRQYDEQRQALQEQVDAAGAAQNLDRRARALGMVPAPNAVFVQLPDGRVLGRPATATSPVPTQQPSATTKPAPTAGASAGASAHPSATGSAQRSAEPSTRQTTGTRQSTKPTTAPSP